MSDAITDFNQKVKEIREKQKQEEDALLTKRLASKDGPSSSLKKSIEMMILKYQTLLVNQVKSICVGKKIYIIAYKHPHGPSKKMRIIPQISEVSVSEDDKYLVVYNPDLSFEFWLVEEVRSIAD